MWWVGKPPLDVYLGTRAVAVLRQHDVIAKSAVEGFDDALQVAVQVLKQSKHRPACRVWLSGGLCQAFLAPAPAEVCKPKEIEALAISFAARRTTWGESCQLWIDERPSAAGRLCAAVGSDLSRQVMAAFSEHARLRSLKPWWAAVLNRSVGKSAAAPSVLGVQDCDSLTLLRGQADEFTAASVVTPLASSSAADAAWARATLSMVDDSAAAALRARLVLDRKVDHPLTECALGALAEMS